MIQGSFVKCAGGAPCHLPQLPYAMILTPLKEPPKTVQKTPKTDLFSHANPALLSPSKSLPMQRSRSTSEYLTSLCMFPKLRRIPQQHSGQRKARQPHNAGDGKVMRCLFQDSDKFIRQKLAIRALEYKSSTALQEVARSKSALGLYFD